MNNLISHRELMESCLSGEFSQQIPVAFWRHFPVDDQNAETFARAIMKFQNDFEFDFIKVTPASSYCIKDWGGIDQWMGNSHGTRDYCGFFIQQPEDWLKLSLNNPKNGFLGMSAKTLELLVKNYSSYTPIIQTIFSPLAQAKNLVGAELLPIHIRKYPEAVHAGLMKITENTINYINHISSLGIDGIFFAVQHAQFSILSGEEFLSFGKKYDLQILNQINNFWLNVAHIHGTDIMFEQIADYPVAILNWHDQETLPSLFEAKQRFNGVVCGGLKQEETLERGSSIDVICESHQAIKQTNGERFVLGTGCVLPITTPFGNIESAIKTARGISPQ